MHGPLDHIDSTLTRLSRLAAELTSDPEGHVRRSFEDLHVAFKARVAIGPAIAHMRRSLRTVSLDNGRALCGSPLTPGLAHLGHVVERDLLPDLRRMGFEV